MAYFSEIVRMAEAKGFVPFLIPGKQLIMLFKCPKCGRTKMGKFLLKTDKQAYIKACPCGYRQSSRKALTAGSSAA